jgi:hypothetical protein
MDQKNARKNLATNRTSRKTGEPMNTNRDQIFAVRTTTDFIQKFDALCDRLGCNRSEVARYCLKKFFNEHFNNPESFKRVRNELF